MFNAYRDFADDSGRPIAALTQPRPRIVLNANRRAVYAAPAFDPSRNYRANGSNRSYAFTTVGECLFNRELRPFVVGLPDPKKPLPRFA